MVKKWLNPTIQPLTTHIVKFECGILYMINYIKKDRKKSKNDKDENENNARDDRRRESRLVTPPTEITLSDFGGNRRVAVLVNSTD